MEQLGVAGTRLGHISLAVQMQQPPTLAKPPLAFYAASCGSQGMESLPAVGQLAELEHFGEVWHNLDTMSDTV